MTDEVMDGYNDLYDQLVDTNPLRLRDLLYERDAEIRRLKEQIKMEHAWKASEVERLSGTPSPCVCPTCTEPLYADVT